MKDGRDIYIDGLIVKDGERLCSVSLGGTGEMSLYLSPPHPGPVLPSPLKIGLAPSPSLLVLNDQLNTLKNIRYKENCYVCVWGSAEGAGSRDLSVLGDLKSGSLVLPLVALLSSIEILATLHNLQACRFLP